MICTNCKSNVNENSKFCPTCGNNLHINQFQQNQNQGMGKLILKRDNKFYGCAIYYNVAINGQDAGVMGNGDELQYNLPFGTYTIELRPITPPCTRQTITLTPQQPNVILNITPGFGKVKIYNIRYF